MVLLDKAKKLHDEIKAATIADDDQYPRMYSELDDIGSALSILPPGSNRDEINWMYNESKRLLNKLNEKILDKMISGFEGRGGPRPGAGRKKVASDKRNKPRSFTMSDLDMVKLESLRDTFGCRSNSETIKILIDQVESQATIAQSNPLYESICDDNGKLKNLFVLFNI